MSKYTWLYQIDVVNGNTTQYDNYADWKTNVDYWIDEGYLVYIEHASKKDPMTYATVYAKNYD